MSNKVVRRIIKIGRRRHVPRKHIIAALETGRVESNFRNLPGGDADSQGWRQERASLYRNPRNLRASINRFYNETKAHDRGQGAGELAADVQRPAAQYRGRYREHHGEAVRLLDNFGGRKSTGIYRGSRSAPGALFRGGRPATVDIGTRTSFDEAGFEQAERRAFLANFLQKSGRGNSVLFRSGLLSTTPPDPREFSNTALTSRLNPGRLGKLTPAERVDYGRAPSSRGRSAGRRGKVVVAPGADRAGVSIKKPVVRFVGQVAGLMGRSLTIGTGTNHSRLTVDGNVSNHWDGNAADVPLRGAALIKAGQDALIAAGMNPRKARRIKGGLYNVGKWQIIYNTQTGGDHTDHLHVGRRG